MIRSDRVKEVGKRCLHCGAALVARGHASRPWRLKTRKVCSPRCWYAWKRASRPACPICGRPRSRAMKTCSTACGYELIRRRGRSVTCRVCKKQFVVPPSLRARSYCSRACYFKSVARRFALVAAECVQCGHAFRRTRAALRRVKRVFCSRACSARFYRGEHSAAWRGGSDPNRGPGWLKVAEEIRKRDGYCCQRCGKSQDENGQKLSVDHIVPWRRFESVAQANHPDNLVSLCRTCHSWKTSRAEQKFLKGDVLDFRSYLLSIHVSRLERQPSASCTDCGGTIKAGESASVQVMDKSAIGVVGRRL